MTQIEIDEIGGGTRLPHPGGKVQNPEKTMQEVGKKSDQERFEAEKRSIPKPVTPRSEQYIPSPEEQERFHEEKERSEDPPPPEPSREPESDPNADPDEGRGK